LPGRERSINVDRIATVTGRVGYAWDNTLFYVKGGWAGVRVKTHAIDLTTGVFSDFTDWSNSWTIGGGIEHVPWQNIIVGLEFNYFNATFDHSGPNSAGVISRNFNTDVDMYTLTFRLSYLFGERVVTNYTP
jgi:outer membrane immunogenic protein